MASIEVKPTHFKTGHSIVPGSGDAGLLWPAAGAIPESYSVGGWVFGNEGVQQQTFLGASITQFNLKGGFGAGTSTLSVTLVEDEFNKSDLFGRGLGDDVYHNGIADQFVPPVMGSPLFFKFGPNMATIEEAYYPTIDRLYRPIGTLPYTPRDYNIIDYLHWGSGGIHNVKSIPSDHHFFYSGSANSNVFIDETRFRNRKLGFMPALPTDRGYNHVVFGGLLQNYIENKGTGGAPLYTADLKDPREILSNVTIILKDYAGSNYGQQNVFNVFAFLEHDPSDELMLRLQSEGKNPTFNPLQKVVNPDGTVTFFGSDLWTRKYSTNYKNGGDTDRIPAIFPMTGEGLGRVSDKGMPFYRISQALAAMLGMYGQLPDEYKVNYGTQINFRGFNYVVDFGGIPLHLLPAMYNVDFAQTDLLSLVQELCDVISHELFVSLLPIIDYDKNDSLEWLFHYNQRKMQKGEYKDMIAGIIRLDAIDRSEKPEYGAVQRYIKKLNLAGVEITNQDLGFELTNDAVDKFVVGAQETKMHFFNTYGDRDFSEVRAKKEGLPNNLEHKMRQQWTHQTALKQQILPFYGFLGKNAVTIPRGWGSYQQILLDSQALGANGVGNYYVATEMELRAAFVSFERWKQFLLEYSETYMESTEENDFLEIALANSVVIDPANPPAYVNDDFRLQLESGISRSYAVTVPRCVFKSDKDYVGEDGLPASPCSPPYGYPLYYKRAEKIGIPEAGIVKIQNAITQIMTDYGSLKQKLGEARDNVEVALAEWNSLGSDAIGADFIPITTDTLSSMYSAVTSIFEWIGITNDTEDERANEVVSVIPHVEAELPDLGGIDDPAVIAGNAVAQAANTINRIKDQMGKIQDVIQKNCKLIKNMDKLGKKTLKNAMEVYKFVKNVADKHLGKTFLVKIPKDCNLDYRVGQLHDAARGESVRGPWGFKPIPASGEHHYYRSEFQNYIAEVKQNSIADPPDPKIPIKHTLGSLKNNYDPITDTWKHNYKPNNAGGYFDYHLNPQTVLPHQMHGNAAPTNFAKNSNAANQKINNQLYLPPAIATYLFPVNTFNFYEDDGRVKAYVRFDNSQFLNFNKVGKDKVFQQLVTANGDLIPDIVEELDNMDADEFHTFDTKEILEKTPKAVAYVKCDVDSKLYMPPKSFTTPTMVFGKYVKDIGAIRKPRKFWNEEKCKFEYTFGYYNAHWVPEPTAGGAGGHTADDKIKPAGTTHQIVNHECFDRRPVYFLGGNPEEEQKFNGMIIETSTKDLDNDHVYALITLPGRVIPTIDSRMKDGPFQLYQGTETKHFLTMDTVKIDDFKEPGWKNKPTNFIADLCSSATLSNAHNSFTAYRTAMRNLTIASPEAHVHFTAPSPVYPDMVALPLESTERCYGPWISSMLDTDVLPFMANSRKRVRFANLGGKCDFVKDESLAPWNYGGYTLLNEAGALKAAFSNSLNLFSERGGFVYAGVPRGNDLGRQLVIGGPLVTDISVDVGAGGVKTTYKMDLYTPKFGKLQKQHEKVLSEVVREKQKLRDQKNTLLRHNLIQESFNTNYGDVFAQYADIVELAGNNSEFFSSLETSNTYSDMIVASVRTKDETLVDPSGNPVRYKKTMYDITTMPTKIFQETMTIFPDQQSRDKAYYNSAGGTWSDLYSPVSEEKHPEMIHEKQVYHKQKQNFLYNMGQDTGL